MRLLCTQLVAPVSLQERPALYRLDDEIFGRPQDRVAVGLTRLRPSSVQVAIQPDPEVAARNE